MQTEEKYNLPNIMSTNGVSVADNLQTVLEKIEVAAAKRSEYAMPRLVAVSKTKTVDFIIEAYEAGQRHFGENYVLELFDKANEIKNHCEDIRWHFIGHLQRNKVSKVLAVPNLFVIETVDSTNLAKVINDTWQRLGKQEPLKVMAQVNTSCEENKSGCRPDEAVQLVKYIREACSNLKLIGLMTIGAYDHDPSTPNPDFEALLRIRAEVCNTLNILPTVLELSMGMSADYEQAIEMGSTNVRVGTKIFGTRGKPYKRSGKQDSSDDENSSADKIASSSDFNPELIQRLSLS